MRGLNLHTVCLVVLAFVVLAGCSRSRPWYDSYSGNRGYETPDYGTPMAPPPRVLPKERPLSRQGSLYTVREGDTLYRVSREYNVPIRALIQANDLEPPYALLKGQRLHIPRARYHTVRKGDTVYSISRAYGVDMATLMQANNITPPYRIRLGERLQLPATVNDQVADSTPAAPAPSPSRPPAADTYTSSPPPAPKGPVPPPPTHAGAFVWPVQGKIIAAFGPQEGGLHNDGINISVPAGTSVRAAQNGVVAYAGNELKGYGSLLLIRHANGWMTAYAHNSKLLVNRGDTVAKGQEIAHSGRTGSVTSPQVHFEIRKGAKAVDPRSVIGG